MQTLKRMTVKYHGGVLGREEEEGHVVSTHERIGGICKVYCIYTQH